MATATVPFERHRWAYTDVSSHIVTPPEFEQMVRRLKLKQPQYLTSEELCSWIRQNYMRRFVPEYLLAALGLTDDATFDS